jgi:hypothetical protein
MNDPENRNIVNAHRCDVLGIRAATCGSEKLVLLTRHPLLQEENSDAS